MAPVVLVGRHPARGIPVEVAIEGDRITRIRDQPDSALPPHLWLLPGLVDIQVNGYAGLDLNGPDVDPGVVTRVMRSLQAKGVTRFCPTVCTQSHDQMRRTLRAIAEACRTDPRVRYGVAGIHVEGPFISPEDGPRGAHPREHVRPPDWEEFEAFQDAAGGRIRVLTLAPEWPGALAFIRRLAGTGVVVAIGHTAAPPEAIGRAVEAGARLSTHLGNGSHSMLQRHPNYIWEQLAADDLWASIIVDGHHLPPAVVKTFVRAKGVARTILISDAVALAGLSPGDYDWLGLRVTLGMDGRIGLTGTPYLAGSTLDLAAAIPKVISFAGVTLVEAVTMASTNPSRLLGIESGILEEGGRADLMVAHYKQDAMALEVQRTVVAGETVWDASQEPH